MREVFITVCEFLGIDSETVNAEVSFVTSEEIRHLNKIHRGIDKPTDVLSFPMLEITPGTVPVREKYLLDINHETNKIELGDVIICTDFAELPVDVLCVHGFLHLLGYDHDTSERETEMFGLTDRILASVKGENPSGR